MLLQACSFSSLRPMMESSFSWSLWWSGGPRRQRRRPTEAWRGSGRAEPSLEAALWWRAWLASPPVRTPAV